MMELINESGIRYMKIILDIYKWLQFPLSFLQLGVNYFIYQLILCFFPSFSLSLFITPYVFLYMSLYSFSPQCFIKC